MKFAITDIETSGFAGTANKITEISIFIFDGEKVLDEFTSLVNPECSIPYKITALTGINDEMVRNAPKFYEIAKKVFEITEDCIFVAHSVNFDYGVIEKEFKELGGEFKRKKLCTVRYSRKAIPNHPSYSLGKICSDLDIPINGRHRARGDVEATVELFKIGLRRDKDKSILNSFLKLKNKEATLPPNLVANNYESLPNATGVYYFKNESGEIIYVGKAKDIKQRIASHFHTKTIKHSKLLQEVAKIDFELTGSELIALLKESAEIKHHYPKYNSAQKRTGEMYALTAYTTQQGVLNLAVNRSKLVTKPITSFKNLTEAHTVVTELCKTFVLCPKYCGIEKVNTGACFSYQLQQCSGVCCNKETVEEYNDKVLEAIHSLCIEKKDMLIKLEGRTPEEIGFVQIANGVYEGYGFAPKKVKEENLQKHLLTQNENKDTISILLGHFRNEPGF